MICNGIAKKYLLAALSATALSAAMSATLHAGPLCTCRYMGKNISLGQTICMKTPEGRQMARCGLMLNNTSWQLTGAPCPAARLSGTNIYAARQTLPMPLAGVLPVTATQLRRTQ